MFFPGKTGGAMTLSDLNSEDSKKIEREFCRKYEIEVNRSHKQRYRRSMPVVQFHSYPDMNDIYDVTIAATTRVPIVELLIPEDRYQELVESEERFRKMIEQVSRDPNAIDDILRREQRDYRVRTNNPAVKLAYEKYMTLLNMVKYDY
jgi:hypothetical protein